MSGNGSTADIHRQIERLLALAASELQVSVGCTDPAAIGLAAAAAVEAYQTCRSDLERTAIAGSDDLLSRILSIEVELDRNLCKNASAVLIPGTKLKGCSISAALGAVLHSGEKDLRLFFGISGESISRALRLEEKIPPVIRVREDFPSLTIVVTIGWSDGETTAASISGRHDALQWISCRGLRSPYPKTDFDPAAAGESDAGDYIGEPEEGSASRLLAPKGFSFTLGELAALVAEVPLEELGLIEEAFRLNSEAASCALFRKEHQPDLRTLHSIYGAVKEDDRDEFLDAVLKGSSRRVTSAEILRDARMAVSAATRARMSGDDIPVMACGGSGNHGITFFLTLLHFWRDARIDRQRPLLRAALLGIVILHAIKEQTGIITPMCGCAVASGIAAAAAGAWGLGGDEEVMLQAMNIVLESVGGIVCDGAKPSCALKTALSSQVAVEAALMAADGLSIPVDEGLGAADFSDLLEYLRILHEEGMAGFDAAMVGILDRKPRMKKPAKVLDSGASR